MAGSHTIVVNHLAQTSSQYSDKITNAGDTLTGSITVTINGQSQQLDVSGKTLSQLAASLSTEPPWEIFCPSVVTDTTGSRLPWSATPVGLRARSLSTHLSMTIRQAPLSALQQGMQGMDASLNVDGLDTTSASNTVTGLIPGVTFQILSVSSNPNVPVQVQITNDNSSIEQASANFRHRL